MSESNATNEALNTLREKLRDMFHFAHNDLDFGIFRILKIKRDEVNQFIDEKLPSIVNEALEEVADTLYENQLTEVREYVSEEGGRRQREWLENIKENSQLLIDFLQTEDKEELIAPLETNLDELKSKLAFRVYNHVHSFFEGYYRDGDFGYNDRSTALYKVDYPDEADYNGADTLFHWKCRDSYYVKTATGFNSVPFEIEGKRIEYRLEGRASSSIAQNNNRDDFKHFRFDRIDPPKPDDTEPTWRVILHLAETSTPKVEIYREMSAQIFNETNDVDIYLHESVKRGAGLGKPIFKDLANTYDKVNDGRLQGIKALHINLENYADKLASHPDFKALGKNKAERQAKLKISPKVQRFFTLDKNLNTFFVGMDSDYFIHKDLDRFLKTEQRRYIQNTILGDLDTLLNLSPENPAFAIAKAFRSVSNEVIALLVAVETFQKQLFLMKKKVVSTDYLISVGKISEATKNNTVQREALVSQILENEAQLTDWRETFGIDITEQLPLLEGLYPTLPLDTRYFNETFVDELLALFDDLESQIGGVLLNSENFQALDLLLEKYRGTIRCIHIDPPYNTNTSGFLYKNDYQHSSWLTMMQSRLSLAEQLMASDSCILCHIDENEYENLFQIFSTLPMKNQGTIVWDKRNPVFGTNTIATQHEYVVCYSKGTVKLRAIPTNREAILRKAASLIKQHSGVTEDCRKEFRAWISNKPELSGGERAYSKIDDAGQVFSDVSIGAPALLTDPKFHEPLIHPITRKPCPVPATGWSRTPENMQKFLDEGRIVFGSDETKQPRLKIYLKNYLVGELSSVLPTGERGKMQLDALGLNFPYSHPIDLYEKLVYAVTNDGKGVALDFFAGSGTTGHAVLNLNKTDNGNRKFILVELGDYFDSTLKERIRRVMFSENWKAGKPDGKKKIDGTVGIVKYQRVEQYEDILDNLTTSPPDYDAKTELPVKYLYRPEEQHVRLMMDMRSPFSNRITYGKDSTEGFVDVLETYCYLKGLPIQHRLRFDFGDQTYRVIQSGKRAVVFRNVIEDMDDTPQLLEILADERLPGVTQLDINYDTNQSALLEGSDLRQIHIITTADFDTGAVWDTVET
ncbi:MAG: site-specific DNA-methyltransferase [Candidatus Poribacteria bacterium]|nr:site-specific DNA-methyltransferase [Candidatus Poribacteria bacterium]